MARGARVIAKTDKQEGDTREARATRSPRGRGLASHPGGSVHLQRPEEDTAWANMQRLCMGSPDPPYLHWLRREVQGSREGERLEPPPPG